MSKQKHQVNDRKNNKIKITILSVVALTAIAIGVGVYAVQFDSSAPAESASSFPEVVVYKSPTCGCCKKWVEHMQESGFKVTAVDKRDMDPVKGLHGVSRQYQSCHTAKVGGYYIEGHVPAAEVKRLLNDKPDAKGLTVPGMPMGSPGMEGHRKDNYSVLLIDKQDAAKVYADY